MGLYGYDQITSSNTVYTTNIDPNELARRMQEEYERQILYEQQKTFETAQKAEREHRFRRNVELLLHRMAQTEVEVSQLTHRLSKAEAEVRQAKGRERKLLTLVREMLASNRNKTEDWNLLNKILREFHRGNK